MTELTTPEEPLAAGEPEPLAEAARRAGQLPVLDRTVMQVIALCNDEDAPTAEIIATLEGDSAFAANLLRYANSAHAARPVRVRTVRQAVMMAGRERIARLAVEAATCRFLERAAGNGRISIGQMQVHATAVGSCALELAQRTGGAADVAHLAGLLHDVGKLLMPLAYGMEALDEIAEQTPGGPERVEAERARFGADHAQAGAMLAEAARLDPAVVTAIAEHHSCDGELTPEIACVQVANSLAGMLVGIDPDSLLLDRALTFLSLDASILDDLVPWAGQLGGSRGARGSSPVGGELTARVAALEHQATTDELTGLANRRHWKERARELLEQGAGAVMLVDIDRFKHVNDRNNHATGDLVLSEVARILSHHGLAGRLGGDELVLLTTVCADRVQALADRLLAEVSDAFTTENIRGWEPGISIGVALVTEQRADIGALLAAADDALYEAKRSGRHRAVFAA